MRTIHSLLFLLAAFTTACTNFSINGTPEHITKELKTYGKAHPLHQITLATPEGKIDLELFDDTPLHRANFLRLIQSGYYGKAPEFYRIREGFMIQGGDPGRSAPEHLVPAEINPQKHWHARGALAMARQDDNPGQASNAAEFYIVTGERWDAGQLAELGINPTEPRFADYLAHGGAPFLDGKYTVFGRVIAGMEVVERIAALPAYGEKPKEKVSFKIEASN